VLQAIKNYKALIASLLCLALAPIGFAQEPGAGPISVEGEFQDPLAPVRERLGPAERLGPGRSSLGPDRSYATEDWSIELGLDYGYVASANLSGAAGSMSEQSGEIAVLASRRIDEGLVGIVGGSWQTFAYNFTADNSPTFPLPDNLQALALILGVDAELSEDWYMRIQIEPGVYGAWQQLGWNQVNIPGVAAFTNIVDEDFQWFIAVRADVFNFFPVIPIPGFRWQFAKDWLFNGSAPKPTIDWKATEDITVFAGGDILNLNARLPESQTGTVNNKNVDGALVNYFEARVGAGVSWAVTPEISLQFEGGAMVWRTFDLPRLNTSVGSTVAPYGQVSLRGQF
jgi:hypothetical protein